MEEGEEGLADSARPWQSMAALLDLPHFTAAAGGGDAGLPWRVYLAPVAGCSPHGGDLGTARVIFFAASPSDL